MHSTRRTVALLTDFGEEDNYVGVMKGVMAGIHPRLSYIDITHRIPQGDIWKAAFLLRHSYAYFPYGTIFLVVVDPEVGSSRRRLLVRTERYFFVGPDNGVLSLAARNDGIRSAHSLEYSGLFTEHPSRTFEGRDVFAHIAASCSLGKTLYKKMNHVSVDSLKMLSLPVLEVYDNSVAAKILYIDTFGNVVVSIKEDDCARLLNEGYTASYKRHRVRRLYSQYSAATEQELFFTTGSFGYLEVAIRNGNAARKIRAIVGERVIFKKRKRT